MAAYSNPAAEVGINYLVLRVKIQEILDNPIKATKRDRDWPFMEIGHNLKLRVRENSKSISTAAISTNLFEQEETELTEKKRPKSASVPSVCSR